MTNGQDGLWRTTTDTEPQVRDIADDANESSDFPDTEEVTGSNPVQPTMQEDPRPDRAGVCVCVWGQTAARFSRVDRSWRVCSRSAVQSRRVPQIPAPGRGEVAF